MRLSDATNVELARGVDIFRREDNVIQFGLDATRTGMIEGTWADALAAVLRKAEEPLIVADLRQQVAEAIGSGEAAAQSLIDELATYRIIVPTTSPTVLLLGTSELARGVSRHVEAAGCVVRSPLHDETEAAFLERHPDATVIAVVDRIPDLPRLSRVIREHEAWHMPVSILDSRVHVGPVGNQAAGPCLMCAQLHLMEIDVRLQLMASKRAHGPVRTDPTVAAAGAVTAAALIRRLSEVPDPPGVVAPPVRAGAAYTVDPFGPEGVSTVQLGRHERCPECFER